MIEVEAKAKATEFCPLSLSLSFPVGGTCHRPNRLQEAHHASWVGRVDFVLEVKASPRRPHPSFGHKLLVILSLPL